MRNRGCVWQGGVRGGGHAGGHAWQGVCIAGGMYGEGACMAGVYGRGIMHGRGGRGAWQILRDTVNERVVRILRECILV